MSDNGRQFVAEDFAVFMKSNGVKHFRCSPYHPASNGAVERFVRTFKQAMRASQQDGLTPQHRLENFLLTYRSTPHATTNVAPCDLFLGRRIRTRLDLVKPNLERRVCEKQANQKQQHDQHVRLREFTIGQQVMVRNMGPGPSWVPGEIKQQLSPLTFLVSVADGQTWKRHVDHLRGWNCNTHSSRVDSCKSDSVTTSRYPSRVRRPPDRLTS